jgi:NAD+ kinase
MKLTNRGSNYERLVEHHNIHYRSLEKILQTLHSRNIVTRVSQRFNYNLEDINWANCILTTGGDGTFLLGATKISSNKKPVIGVNTDVSEYFYKTFNKIEF